MYHIFVSNVIDVLFLCGVVLWINLSLNRKYSHYILGVMFGLITIFVIQGHFMVVEGRFFDFRHITMTMAGFIGGPVTAVIAAIISSVYWYNVGGTGSFGGIVSIIVFACFGSILGRCVKSSQNGKKLLFWFMIGIGMACIWLFIIAFTFPSMSSSSSVTVLRTAAVRFLIITPFATTIIFNFYFWTHQFFTKASILDTILNHSPMNLMIFDAHGPILSSKTLKTELPSYPYIENPSLLLDLDKTWSNTTKQQCKDIATEDERYFVTDLSRFQMSSGKYAWIAIVNDITDRKREQEKLRVANERFSKAFQLGPHMMSIIQKSDYRCIDVNRRFLEVRGFEYEDVIGKTPMEIGVSKNQFNKMMEILREKGAVQNVEDTIITKNGPRGTVIFSAEEIQIDDQECILFAYNDITEMKRMQTEMIEQLTKRLELEADLSQGNQLIADIINNMPDCFLAMDREGQFTYINRAGELALGKSRSELLGEKVTEVFEVSDNALQHYREVMIERRAINFEVFSVQFGNKWLEFNVYPIENGLTCYFRDITSRKIAEETLRLSEEKFSKAFHGGPIMMTLGTVEEGKLIEVNEALCSGTGYTREEIIGRTTKELNIFIEYDKMHEGGKKLMEQGRIENAEFDFRTKSGEIRHGLSWSQLFYLDGHPCHITGLIDVTEQRRIHQEMAKMDRFDLVGQLAAGIAHEIRNPMTTVRGYIQLLGSKPEYEAKKSTFELMISELDRANAIITEFLSLAQTKQTELKHQNLNDIINNLYPLIEADAFIQNKQISFFPGEIPNIGLNTNEISQLVLNLIRNGLDAMMENGSLTIKSYVDDRKVVLSIADEGCGIPLEDISKLGTPFFTTKESGTGLGLATCYKIAECHNAKVHIDSSPSGTTFFILFPIPDKEQEKIA